MSALVEEMNHRALQPGVPMSVRPHVRQPGRKRECSHGRKCRREWDIGFRFCVSLRVMPPVPMRYWASVSRPYPVWSSRTNFAGRVTDADFLVTLIGVFGGRSLTALITSL
jgi:hypothetical protein